MKDLKTANLTSTKLHLTRDTVKNLRVRSGFQTGLANAIVVVSSVATGPGMYGRCTHSEV